MPGAVICRSHLVGLTTPKLSLGSPPAQRARHRLFMWPYGVEISRDGPAGGVCALARTTSFRMTAVMATCG